MWHGNASVQRCGTIGHCSVIAVQHCGGPDCLLPEHSGPSPVDSFVVPEPWDMPGYTSQVIMAAGAFVQGSSIELSADAPIKKPYTAYVQGGLTYAHGRLGVMLALDALWKLNICG